MSNESKPPSKGNPAAAAAPAPSGKSWTEVLYAPERVEKWIKGEMSMAELDGFTHADLLEFAEMGYSQYESGKYEEARVIFTGLIALNDKEPYYRVALGCVFLGLENLDRAIELFNQALALDANYLAAYVNRGEAYLGKGEILQAAQDFTKAVQLDPKGETPFSRRAKALAAAAVETLEAAGIGGANTNSAPESAKAGGSTVTSVKPTEFPKVPPPPKKK